MVYPPAHLLHLYWGSRQHWSVSQTSIGLTIRSACLQEEVSTADLVLQREEHKSNYLTKGTWGLEAGRKIKGWKEDKGMDTWRKAVLPLSPERERKGPRFPTFLPIDQGREQRYAEGVRSHVRAAGRLWEGQVGR